MTKRGERQERVEGKEGQFKLPNTIHVPEFNGEKKLTANASPDRFRAFFMVPALEGSIHPSSSTLTQFLIR
jgi:hypothetical protein